MAYDLNAHLSLVMAFAQARSLQPYQEEPGFTAMPGELAQFSERARGKTEWSTFFTSGQGMRRDQHIRFRWLQGEPAKIWPLENGSVVRMMRIKTDGTRVDLLEPPRVITDPTTIAFPEPGEIALISISTFAGGQYFPALLDFRHIDPERVQFAEVPALVLYRPPPGTTSGLPTLSRATVELSDDEVESLDVEPGEAAAAIWNPEAQEDLTTPAGGTSTVELAHQLAEDGSVWSSLDVAGRSAAEASSGAPAADFPPAPPPPQPLEPMLMRAFLATRLSEQVISFRSGDNDFFVQYFREGDFYRLIRLHDSEAFELRPGDIRFLTAGGSYVVPNFDVPLSMAMVFGEFTPATVFSCNEGIGNTISTHLASAGAFASIHAATGQLSLPPVGTSQPTDCLILQQNDGWFFVSAPQAWPGLSNINWSQTLTGVGCFVVMGDVEAPMPLLQPLLFNDPATSGYQAFQGPRVELIVNGIRFALQAPS